MTGTEGPVPAPDSILLTDRVAVVTGAGRGIGAATAVALARFGAHVAVFDKEHEGLADTVQQVVATGSSCICDIVDARDGDEVALFLRRARDRLGPIDVLVNNAGGTFRARFDDVSPKGEQALVRENFSTVTNCVRHGVPLMSDGGAVINVTSVEAYHAAPAFGVYAAMKAAVEQFTKTLAVEYGHRGIRVNCVAPDMIPTPGDAALAEGGTHLIEGTHPTPLRRMGAAQECAAVIVFLASDMASFINGASIPVDGGTVASGNWKTRLDGSFGL
ncbi:MAG: SDR family NAD(P)-dependent oxidoreductase [Acidimicrobiaceae bacterium]|nr:SDR family NAD(P)-dependent oxidoreductase [Acidimicrobiaceae bacterium]